MTNFVEKDENGKVIYRGFISLEEKEKGISIPSLKGKIEFKHVYFAY